jgi:hypothetical protein
MVTQYIILTIFAIIVLIAYFRIPVYNKVWWVIPWIMISGFHTLFIITLMQDNKELKQKQPKEQYEQVTETFYRKIK